MKMEMRINMKPFEVHRAFVGLNQTEKIQNLPNNPLQNKAAAPTSKNQPKRRNLNHLAKDRRRTEKEILDSKMND